MTKKKQKKGQTGQQFLSPEQFMKQRARSLEIGTRYITGDIEECGEGLVVVTRRHTGGRVSLAIYMVDTFCLGVKDSHYHLRLEEDEMESILDRIPDLKECTYEEAHNRVYGAISWAEEAGIKPAGSFSITRYMLEEDTDDVPLIEYEFGRDGKHFLVANSNLEASRYLPLLRKNLGEGEFDFVINTDKDDLDFDLDPDDVLDRLSHISENPIFKSYGPSTEYTYKHPHYPASLELESPGWLYEELSSPKYPVCLPDELTDRILALPHDALRRDLERIVLYHIGLTCDGIPDDYSPDGYAGLLGHCIILLGEVGNADSSLDVVLEALRQSHDFMDYHVGDAGDEIFVPTLYLLGQNRLDKLMDYMKEEGLETFCKCHVFPAVGQVAMAQPERRREVLDWFREMIRFATKMLPRTRWFDSDLAGLMLHPILDIQGVELLPELREMFATGLVDLGACGDFPAVMRMIADPRYKADPDSCITEVHARFADMKLRWTPADNL